MPDQVPLRFGEFSQRRGFFLALLDSIFAEHSQASAVSLDDARGLHGLAHGHQRDGVRVASYTLCSGGHALADSGDVFGYRHPENYMLPRASDIYLLSPRALPSSARSSASTSESRGIDIAVP